jgi:hypothetical protein
LQGPPPSAAPFLVAGAWALGVIALTGVHHAYGAFVYDTPWRLHILDVGIPIGALIAAALSLAWWRAGTAVGRVALWAGVATVIVFPVLLIGIYEGGFNHLAKNIAYLGWGLDGVATLNAVGGNALVEAIVQFALGHDAYVEMAASDLLEPPGDSFFELTGVAQVPAALVAGWAALKLWWSAR